MMNKVHLYYDNHSDIWTAGTENEAAQNFTGYGFSPTAALEDFRQKAREQFQRIEDADRKILDKA